MGYQLCTALNPKSLNLLIGVAPLRYLFTPKRAEKKMTKARIATAASIFLLSFTMVMSQRPTEPNDEQVICFSATKAIIYDGGTAYTATAAIAALLQRPAAFTAAATSQPPKQYFGVQPFRCVLASPGSSALSFRYAAAKTLIAGAAERKHISTSDLAVTGYQHFFAKEDEDEKVRLFIVLGKKSVSATLVSMGMGVNEVNLSVGMPIESAATPDTIATVMKDLMQPLMKHSDAAGKTIDEYVLTGIDSRAIAARLSRLYNGKPPVIAHEDLMKRSLIVGAAQLAKLPQTGSQILLPVSPNTRIGVILSTDSTLDKAATITGGKYAPEILPTLGHAYSLFNGPVEMARSSTTVKAGEFVEFVEPFTTYPMRTTRTFTLKGGVSHLILAENTGRDVGRFHSIDLQKHFKAPPTQLEVSVELDFNLKLSMKVTNLATGQQVLYSSDAAN